MIQKSIAFLKVTSNLIWLMAGFILAVLYTVYRLILPYKEGSHPISRFFCQFFADQKAKINWGVFFLTTILLANFYLLSDLPLAYLGKNKAVALEPVLICPENVVKTETTFKKPVSGYISQGYHWYHQAIDLATNLGQEIHPVTSGKVIQIEYGRWGYGHFVIVEHDFGYKSLYAHLGDIKVQTGQTVDKNTLLGYVGVTGRTSGPHLHLEIYEDTRLVNPMEVVPDLIEQLAYLAN